MPRRKGKFAFDMGLDYAQTRELLADRIAKTRFLCTDFGLNPRRHLTHCSILLVQLTNGSRVSEAFDAVEAWGKDGKREQQVRVRKLGKRRECLICGQHFSIRSKTNSSEAHTQKTGHSDFEDFESTEKRLMVIPSECLDSDLPFVAQALEKGLSVGSVKVFALRQLHFNTHALRYAKITSLSDQGQPAQIVSKITHHKNLNFITDYTSQKTADEILRKSVE